MKNCLSGDTKLLPVLFFFLLLFCYHNSFQASWHFDDIANIVLNKPLHLTDLSPTSLQQTFFAYPDHPGKFSRPVANLTIALNWFFCEDKVFGYHVVNFLIHFLTTLFLYHTCLLLLSTPTLGDRYHKNKVFISALAAILWAVNPVQTQAITYIVQRMASLATLFSIIVLWHYLKGRLLPAGSKQSIYYYMGACLFFLLAVGSKENAVLLPASIALVELIFFQHSLRLNKKTILFFLISLAITLACTLALVGPSFFQGILSSYDARAFTPLQRLFTEARIVVFYLSQLFFPSPLRLSITHDIQLSTSLFSPPTTLPAILFLTLVTLLAFVYRKRYPLSSFAILFFLLNHTVESTIISLELFFEHRNYLPSLFLFLPLAAAIDFLLHQYRQKNKIVHGLIVSGVAFTVLLLSLGTIARNKVWLTERSLWSDSLKKAPQSARSYINLGHGYLFRDKNYKKAFELNYLSLEKYSPTPWKDRFRAYNNLGYIMNLVGNYQEALNFYDKALASSQAKSDSSLNTGTLFYKTRTLWLDGQTDKAIDSISNLVQKKPEMGKYLQWYGELLVHSGNTADGLDILQQALVHSPSQGMDYQMTLLDLSLVYGARGDQQKARFYINIAQKMGAPLIPKALCALEISLRTEQPAKADRAFRLLLSQLTWLDLMAILEETSPERPTLPLDFPMLRQYASDWLNKEQTS